MSVKKHILINIGTLTVILIIIIVAIKSEKVSKISKNNHKIYFILVIT